MTAITVVATITAKPGKQDEVFALLQTLIAPSRAEEGNLQYDLHRSNDDASVFVFVETWASREILTRHAQSAHFTAFQRQASALVDNLDIKMLTKVA